MGDLPVGREADAIPTPTHTLADDHIFGHVRLGPSCTLICGVCEDAGRRIGVSNVLVEGQLVWRHDSR